MSDACENFVAARAAMAPDFVAAPLGRVRGGVDPADSCERVTVSPEPALKCVIDRGGAALGLLLLTPVLLVISLLILFDSRGPILFRQERTGLGGRPFTIFKFRTMFADRCDHAADRQTSRDDDRVTRVGRVLRRSSLDELPQLLNVLRGDMSLVGPRPHAPRTRVDGVLLADAVSSYALRHQVRPGMTGLAQINGFRGELTTAAALQGRLDLDLRYVAEAGPLLDLRILLVTVTRCLFAHEAY